MPRGGGSSSRGGGGGFSFHSHSGSGRSRSSSGGGFSSHSHSGSGRSHSSGGGFFSGSGSSSGRSGSSGGGLFSSGRKSMPFRGSGLLPHAVSGIFRRSRPVGSGPAFRSSGRAHYNIGCGGYILLLFLLLMILGVLFSGGSDKETVTSRTTENTVTVQTPVSTVTRVRLASSLCKESSEWYRDDWGDWVDDDSSSDQRALLNSLRSFYTATGVQPFLWITGPQGASIRTESALQDAAAQMYDSLFDDQGHLVLIFREYPNASGNYLSGCYAGSDAETVIDAEAREILLSSIDRYYENESLSDSRMFANAFSDAAASIMRSSGAVIPVSGEKKGSSATDIIARIFLIAIFVGIAVLYLRRVRVKNAAAPEVQPETQETPQPAPEVQQAPQRAPEYTVVKCPYCGAKTKILKDEGGLCEYCGMKVTEDDSAR